MSNLKGTRDTRSRFLEYRRRAHLVQSYVGVASQVGDLTLQELTGIPKGEIRTLRTLLVAIGAVEWENGQPGQLDSSTWRFLKIGAALDAALDLEMERQMRGGMSPESEAKKLRQLRRRPPTRRSVERVAVAEDRLGFAVAAVSGPERPEALRSSLVGTGPNAPAALVMAAKQYASGRDDDSVRKAKALVKELNDIGVPVPAELAARAVAKKDDRLEAVALVLPYVEDLERRLVRAEDQIREWKDYGNLRQTVERQRSQIERLVAERTREALSERPHRS